MIRTLIYLIIILLGLCLSPYLANNTGYLFVAIGDYELETSVIFAIFALIIFYALLQFVEWLFVALINLLISSRYIPQRWRQKTARKHTLTGALALAEEDWPAVEKAMVKGANQGELPALNWLAAARAAQHQQHYQQRNDYLTQAEAEPRAKNAVNTSRCRYLYQQGELAQARQALDALVPCSKSNDSLLLLAVELYRAQQDWPALRALLPIIAKRQLMQPSAFDQLSLSCNSALITEASNKGEQALDNCWGWLTRAERNNNHYLSLYALGLHRCGRSAEAWKLVYKKIKSAADADLFAVIPDMLNSSDTEYRQQLFALESKYVMDSDFHICAAKLYLQNRDFSLAKNHYLQASQLDESNKSTWLGLAECQHQLGEHYGASQSYKQAAQL